MALCGSLTFPLINSRELNSQSSATPNYAVSAGAKESAALDSDQALKFEVASVRQSPPGGSGMFYTNGWGKPTVTLLNAPFRILIELAYNISSDHIVGAPSWFDSETYDINAKMDGEKPLTYEQARPLLQQLLKERFHLAVHREMKDFNGYALVGLKKGVSLGASKTNVSQMQILPGQIQCPSCSMSSFAAMLAVALSRPIEDKTGLNGTYNVKLDYAPEGAIDSPSPSIYTALQEQLGLKLLPQKVPAEVVIIDHAERVPTEN